MATAAAPAANAANAANAADSNVTDINAARPKSHKKWFVIAGVALLLSVGGGAAAWYFMKPPASEAHAAVKPPPPAPVFLELEPFTVNLAGDRILQTGITLQLKDVKDGEQLKLYMPQLKSRMLLLLSAKTVDELQSPTGKQALTTEIGASLKQPYATDLAPPSISGVFLTSFVIQ